MRKTRFVASLIAAALPAVAQAAFLVTYPTTQVVPGPPAPPAVNNFHLGLASFGIQRFASTGANAVMTTGGLVKFEFFAREALLNNKFTVGSISFTAAGPATINHFAVGPVADNAPVNLGTLNLTPAQFNPTFFTNGAGPAITPGSLFFGIGIPNGQPATNGAYLTNTLWLMFDDNTGAPDDNHDDLIIRATFAVPEPSTWAMMIGGFGVIGVAMRRRRNYRVSFV
jgi:PEP-CTERM motif